MNLKISGRDLASPLPWGSARGGMAWHHIIPYSMLRDVWNRLVDQHIATELPEARVAIRQYLVLCDRNQPNLEQLIDRMRSENTGQKRAGHHELPPLDVPEANRLATAAVWPAWNAVEGPRARSDDPRDRYFDRFTFGLTPAESARMTAIETLFGRFQVFVRAGSIPTPAGLRALAEAASTARPIVCCDRPIAYRPTMWVEDGIGRWRKRRTEDPNDSARR